VVKSTYSFHWIRHNLCHSRKTPPALLLPLSCVLLLFCGCAHLQASKGYANIMRQLLKAGAKVNAKDKTGSTPLHRAAGAGKFDTVLVLLEEGHAKVDSHDKTGSTALSVAVACKEANIAILLASKGANLEVSTQHHTACVCQALCDCVCDPSDEQGCPGNAPGVNSRQYRSTSPWA
jgi:hypothetical protein